VKKYIPAGAAGNGLFNFGSENHHVAEYNITVVHTTSGKESLLAVEETFSVASVLEVLAESLHLKDRFVLATKENKILDPQLTLKDAGVVAGAVLLLMPDPTGG